MNDNATRTFIQTHLHDDTHTLALAAHGKADIDLPYALDQIAGWQTACHKLPTWATQTGIVYPPHLSMEQCSSQATALYKAMLAQRLMKQTGQGPYTMADLTGGFGVDFSFIAPLFSRATYVEQQENLCNVARHNFEVLHLSQAQVVCADAAGYLAQMHPVHLLYLDPARRNVHGGKTVSVDECSPNVAELLPVLLQKARTVMVKLSPMLDWHLAVKLMQQHVAEVHIVATGGECKELLLVLDKEQHPFQQVVCTNDGQTFTFSTSQPYSVPVPTAPALLTGRQQNMVPEHPMFLYEPNATVMKAGCFAAMAAAYGVQAIGSGSHLFVGNTCLDQFPGRRFQIRAITTMNRRAMKAALKDIGQASVSVRNFPLTAQQLRARLKLKESSRHYIFGTTGTGNIHLIILCERI